MAVTYRLLLDKKRKIENAAAGVCVFLAHPAACVELIVPLLVLFAGGDLNQLLQMEEAQSVRFLRLIRRSSHGSHPSGLLRMGAEFCEASTHAHDECAAGLGYCSISTASEFDCGTRRNCTSEVLETLSFPEGVSAL